MRKFHISIHHDIFAMPVSFADRDLLFSVGRSQKNSLEKNVLQLRHSCFKREQHLLTGIAPTK